MSVVPTQDPVTATLRPLLAGQLRRLRQRFLWHGIGLTLLCAAGAILLFFTLDHWLDLPLPIRLLHTTTVLALVAFGCLRFLHYPLTRTIGEVDLAVWLERTFPELHQRFVSAVQLHAVDDAMLRNQSRAMIEQLLDETAAAARQLPLDRTFDSRTTSRVLGGAGLLLTTLVLGTALAPETAQAFVLRHLGFAAKYPRRTTLIVELPPAGPDLQREDHADETLLTLPAGADLHVTVLAQGSVPKEVYLVSNRRDGSTTGETRKVLMTARPGNRFRHVFRRLSGSWEFHADGGDDHQGDRLVVVRTVHPPQVVAPRATIHPPAYTGAEPFVQGGGAIEALVGSEVELTVATTAPVRQATMVFLESGRRLELTPTVMQDDSGQSTVQCGRFTLESSDRYQIELLADSGLRNPNPGTYPISALQDYAPVGRWLLPDDEGTPLLPEALLCVRFEAHDDFGLSAVNLAIEHASKRSLERAMLPASTKPTTRAVITDLFEVRDLLGAERSANDGLVLKLSLRDNRQPQAGATELPPRIVQVVDAPQLAAVIGRTFRSLREEVGSALEIQSDRRARLEEIAAVDDTPEAQLSQSLTGVEVGQGRIAGATERLHRGLMRAFDLHLWNRLETSQHAAQVIELFKQHSSTLREPIALDPAFYRDLQQRRQSGTLGAMETTLDPILSMLAVADRLATTSAPEASRLLAQVQVARDRNERIELVQRTLKVQGEIEQALKQLLERLEEWNDYQDVIQVTRALRDRQRDLQNRTEEAKGK